MSSTWTRTNQIFSYVCLSLVNHEQLEFIQDFVTQQAIVLFEIMSEDSLKQQGEKNICLLLDKHVCDSAVCPWTAWKDGQGKKTVDWPLDSGPLPPGCIQHPSYLTCFLQPALNTASHVHRGCPCAITFEPNIIFRRQKHIIKLTKITR